MKSVQCSRYLSVNDCQSCICVSKYLRPNYCHPGEGLGRAGSSGGMRGLTGEHLESTCSTQEHTPASWAPRQETGTLTWLESLHRDTWHVTPCCLPPARHVSTCALCDWHIMVCQYLLLLATEAGLQPETAQQRRDLLASQLGSWEKRKVCFNLLLHLHFDICGQFRFRFWQMSVPANRELCVFCKIRLMGDWRTEIGSRLTQEQRTTQDSHKCVAEVSSWYSNLFLVSLKLCVLQLR